MICICHFCKKIIFVSGAAQKWHFLEVLAKVFQNYWIITNKVIEFPNIFHWKPAKKKKIWSFLEQNLSQIRPNVVKKRLRNWHYQ